MRLDFGFVGSPLTNKINQNMSSSLTTLVPVLSGPNYTSWAPMMQSFLMSQEQCKVIMNHPPKAIEISLATDIKEAEISNQEEITTWWDLNTKALGNICLRLHHTIQYNQCDSKTTAQLWETLEENYSKPGMASIYLELKAAFDMPIPANSDPSLALEKITSHFGKLSEAGSSVTLSTHLQALILMAKLPPTFDSLAQIMCQTDKITNLDLEKVKRAIIVSWDQRNNGGGRAARPQKNANAISGVQRGARDTPFNSSSNTTCVVKEEDVNQGEDKEARINVASSSSSNNNRGIRQTGMLPAPLGCHHLLSSPHPISVLER